MLIKKLKFETDWNRITFINLKEEIKTFIEDSGIQNGILVVHTLHTTCSVFFEEMVHDKDGLNYDFLQHDLIQGLNRIFPKQTMYDANYKYPGPEHRKYCYENFLEYKENPAILLNADAHLKASLVGSSVSIIVENGQLLTGEFGDIYFVDWDQNRKRTRTCVLGIVSDEL